MKVLICNYCGKELTLDDEGKCPLCGTNSVQEKEEDEI